MEAMRLQGALSPRVEAKLDELLGHPATCPHGNPIDLETARRRPSGIPLSELESGSKATVLRITEEAEEDAGLLSYLEARALTPGAHVTVLARSESLDSLTLDGPRGRATLGLRPAALDPGASPARPTRACSTRCRRRSSSQVQSAGVPRATAVARRRSIPPRRVLDPAAVIVRRLGAGRSCRMSSRRTCNRCAGARAGGPDWSPCGPPRWTEAQSVTYRPWALDG